MAINIRPFSGRPYVGDGSDIQPLETQPKYSARPYTGDGSDIQPLLEPTAGEKAADVVGDTLVGLGKGVLQIPGAVTGLGDVAAGLAGFNRPFSKLAEKAGESTGFQPGQWAQESDSAYSPAMKLARTNVQQAWQDPNTSGLDVAKAYLENPRSIYGTVVESLPSMVAGNALGRTVTGLGKLPASTPAAELAKRATLASGVGEGAIMAGQAMENIDPNVDPQKAALASLGIGLGGGLIGTQSGRFMNKVGLGDIDTLIASRGLAGAGSKAISLPLRVAANAIQEGPVEEGSQSALETGLQNWAENKPITQDMARNVVEGSLAGMAMGAPAGFVSRGPLTNAVLQGPQQLQGPQEVQGPQEIQGAHGVWSKPGFNVVPDADAMVRNRSIPGAGTQEIIDRQFQPSGAAQQYWEQPNINQIQSQVAKNRAFFEAEQADLRKKEDDLIAMEMNPLTPKDQVKQYRKQRIAIEQERRKKVDEFRAGLGFEDIKYKFGDVKNDQLKTQLSSLLNAETQNAKTQTHPAADVNLRPEAVQQPGDEANISHDNGALGLYRQGANLADDVTTLPTTPEVTTYETNEETIQDANRKGPEEGLLTEYRYLSENGNPVKRVDSDAFGTYYADLNGDAIDPDEQVREATPEEIAPIIERVRRAPDAQESQAQAKTVEAGKQIPVSTDTGRTPGVDDGGTSGVSTRLPGSNKRAEDADVSSSRGNVSELKQPWDKNEGDSDRWFGSRVEIQPIMKGELPIQGAVKMVLKGSGSSVVEVQPDGMDSTFRYTPDRLKVLSIVDSKATDQASDQDNGKLVDNLVTENKLSLGDRFVHDKEFIATAAGQKYLSSRGQRTGLLNRLNEQVGYPYSRDELINIADDKIDEVRDYLVRKYQQRKFHDGKQQDSKKRLDISYEGGNVDRDKVTLPLEQVNLADNIDTLDSQYDATQANQATTPPQPAPQDANPNSPGIAPVGATEAQAGTVGANIEKNGLERGVIGGKYAAKQVILTASGRQTTPFPGPKLFKKVDSWLLENAALEAESRGDEFNSRIFRDDLKQKIIPQASKDSAEEYLFGQQPELPKPFLKPLIKQEAQNAEQIQKSNAANAGRRAQSQVLEESGNIAGRSGGMESGGPEVKQGEEGKIAGKKEQEISNEQGIKTKNAASSKEGGAENDKLIEQRFTADELDFLRSKIGTKDENTGFTYTPENIQGVAIGRFGRDRVVGVNFKDYFSKPVAQKPEKQQKPEQKQDVAVAKTVAQNLIENIPDDFVKSQTVTSRTESKARNAAEYITELKSNIDQLKAYIKCINA